MLYCGYNRLYKLVTKKDSDKIFSVTNIFNAINSVPFVDYKILNLSELKCYLEITPNDISRDCIISNLFIQAILSIESFCKRRWESFEVINKKNRYSLINANCCNDFVIAQGDIIILNKKPFSSITEIAYYPENWDGIATYSVLTEGVDYIITPENQTSFATVQFINPNEIKLYKLDNNISPFWMDISFGYNNNYVDIFFKTAIIEEIVNLYKSQYSECSFLKRSSALSALLDSVTEKAKNTQYSVNLCHLTHCFY